MRLPEAKDIKCTHRFIIPIEWEWTNPVTVSSMPAVYGRKRVTKLLCECGAIKELEVK